MPIPLTVSLIQVLADSALSPGAGSGGTAPWHLEGIQNWIQEVTGLSFQNQGKLLASVAVVLGVYLLRRFVMRMVHRRVDDPRIRYRWSESSSRVAFVAGLLLMAVIWLEAIGSFGTFFGLLSAGVAIALKDLVVNFAVWIFILWRRPFQIGDRIQIGEVAGDVVDIGAFQFALLEIGNWVDTDEYTGRGILVPNYCILKEPLANYTSRFQFIWNEIPVAITFESDWRKAKTILQGILDEKSRDHMEAVEESIKGGWEKSLAQFKSLKPSVFTSVDRSGILLTLRYTCHARQRRSTAQGVWESLLEAFSEEPDIQFAYPTTRTVRIPTNREPDAGAPLPERPERGGGEKREPDA